MQVQGDAATSLHGHGGRGILGDGAKVMLGTLGSSTQRLARQASHWPLGTPQRETFKGPDPLFPCACSFFSQTVCNFPIVIQPSQAEKNQAARLASQVPLLYHVTPCSPTPSPTPRSLRGASGPRLSVRPLPPTSPLPLILSLVSAAK